MLGTLVPIIPVSPEQAEAAPLPHWKQVASVPEEELARLRTRTQPELLSRSYDGMERNYGSSPNPWFSHMRFRYLTLCLGCVDLIVLALAWVISLDLPKTWFSVAIGLSFVATAIFCFYSPHIQIAIFPLFLFIDTPMLFVLDSPPLLSPDSTPIISIGSTFRTAFGAVIHVASALFLFILNLFLILRSRASKSALPAACPPSP